MGRTPPNERITIKGLLRRLEGYPTVPPFSRLYYHLISEQLNHLPHSLEASKLRQSFGLFLRCECRRHQRVNAMIRRGKFDMPEIYSAGHSAHDALQRLSYALNGLSPISHRDNMIRELILAECDYHLGHTENVIHALRHAVALGIDHPLVHFSLGYNLYCYAMKRYTHAGERRGEVVTSDPTAFEGICHDAIIAFRHGVSGGALDGQIHWWIGLIFEILGEYPAARCAYQLASTSDPTAFTGIVKEKINLLANMPTVSRTFSESKRLAGLGPIDEDEIKQTEQLLSETDLFENLFPADDFS